MPKPRRRRRFFALEGRFEVDDSGEMESVVDPARTDLSAVPAEVGDEDISARGSDAGQTGSEEISDAPEPSDDEKLPPAFRLNRAPRTRSEPRPAITRWSLLLALACLGVGVCVGYLSARNGRKSIPAEASSGLQKDAALLTPADEQDLDAAYAARHAFKYEEAEQLFAALARRHPDWGPIKVELGRTFFYANKSTDASAALKAAAEKSWKPAEANFLLGVLNKARKSYPEAELCFAKAVAIDPTDPQYYFFWGECLREEGKLLEAAAKLRSALLRNQYETATGLYRVKLWLCAVEADQDGTEGVNAQIDAALAQPHPPMDALLAAAARDIKAGNFAEAAVHLSRARRRADATVFRYVISDPVFVPAHSRPELAEFFRSDSPGTHPVTDTSPGSPAPSPTAIERGTPVPSQFPASPAKAKKP